MHFPVHKTPSVAKLAPGIAGLKHYIQPSLKINRPGDLFEQEADAMAEKVVHSPSIEPSLKKPAGLIGASVQRKCAACEEEEKKRKPLMRKAEGSNPGLTVSPVFMSSLQNTSGGGSPLPPTAKGFMENAFSADFSAVRVHADAKSSDMSKGINAKAFTYGRDIYFSSGEYAPESTKGRKLLAHELTHVVQQSASGFSVQRAEVDDNPAFCFPTDGSQQLQDVGYLLNDWIATAQANGKQNNVDGPTAIINELAALQDSLTTVAEYKIANLAPSQVRHVTLEESRYNVNRLGREIYKYKGKSPVSPVINLCGHCVGADKIGHFFQQGGEYFRIAEALRKQMPGVPESMQDDYIENITHEYGRYLEGFSNTLTMKDILWLKKSGLMPFKYVQGIYGTKSSGILSNADLEANRQGGRFLRDAMRNPSVRMDICPYVNDNWNEHFNPNAYGGTEMFTLKTDPIDETSKVYFNTGSAQPDEMDIIAIARNMSAFASNLNNDKYFLRLEGYASMLGSTARNQKLSEDRAQAVKKRLEFHLAAMINDPNFEFDQDNISLVGNGEFWADFDEDKPAVDDSQSDRVVDVFFTVF